MSDWYYAVDNTQKGPINEAELKEFLATNKVAPDALVWKDGMENWTPANQVPALSFRQPPIPAKVQPPAAGAPAASTTVPATAATPDSSPDSTKPTGMSDIIGTPESMEPDYDDAEKNKAFAILAYIGILFVVPLIAAKDSPYAKYHANQGLALFLTMFALITVLTILAYFPFIGFIFGLLHIPAYLGYLGLMILGIINAANGKCVPLPVIGSIKPINNLLK
jgi:uncharacterized membrane protein